MLKKIKYLNGIIIPGGFRKKGINGKIKAIKFAREKKLPFLGLCLGFQLAAIEFAQNVIKLKNATSTEFNPKTKHPIITIIEKQKNIKILGATMRLGSEKIIIKKNTLVYQIYKKTIIFERHRHRYELNPKYHNLIQKYGLILSGFTLKNKKLVEFLELPKEKHKFFIATQAHPEFESKFLKPHPLFIHFLKNLN